MYRLLVTVCALAIVFNAPAAGQDKKNDPFDLEGIGKGLLQADIALRVGILKLEKGHLKLKLDGYEHSRFVLRTWKEMMEKEWPKFSQEEKVETRVFIKESQRFAQILGPKKMVEEVIPVAAAAFGVGKIIKPTELQKKIMVIPSKEKDEAKRIALTIRECLRYTAEDDILLKNQVAKIDQQIAKLQKLLSKSSPKKENKKTEKK